MADNWDAVSTAAPTSAPVATSDEWDKVSTEAPVAHDAPYYLAAKPNAEDHWKNLYGGLDGLDARVKEHDWVGFSMLDKVSKDPKEDRAKAINQAFISEKTDMPGQYLSRNWEATKLAYAKQEMGIDIPQISDEVLYNHIATRLGAQGEPDNEADGTVKSWTWRESLTSDWVNTKKNVGRFYSSISKPLAELPSAPNDLPNVWMTTSGGVPTNPALTAAVWNGGLKPILDSLESPMGVATLGVGTELKTAAQTYPLAKAALVTMGGFFTGLMAHDTVVNSEEVKRVQQDPNSTFQDRATAWTKAVTSTGATVIGAVGTAFEALPESEATKIAGEMKGKTPAQSAKILRAHAASTDQLSATELLNNAAAELDKMNVEAQVAGDNALAPKPEPEKLKENTRLSDLIGKQVRYSGYGGKLIRDAEGNFMILREVAQQGTPQMIEVADTGKSAQILADDVGVVPEEGWEYRTQRSAPEKIVAAGIRTEDGEVTEGVSHDQIENNGSDEEADSESKNKKDGEHGFVTNKGRFVSRTEAATIAKNEGQLTEEAGKEPPEELHSHQVEYAPRETISESKPYAPGKGIASMKHEVLDDQRKEMGLEPATRAEKDDWDASVKKANAKAKEEPDAGKALIDELDRKNRPLGADEKALAVNELNRLKIQREVAAAYVEKAQASGDKEALGDAKIREAKAIEEFDRASNVLTKSGSLSGQSLAAQKLILNEDYSLAGIERRVTRAKGSKLTDEELGKIEKVAGQLKETQDELAKLRAEMVTARAKPPASLRVPRSRVSAFLSDAADAARARRSARFAGKVFDAATATVESAKDLADLAIIGADYLGKGVTEFAAWSAAMLKEFGDTVKPHLKGIFDEAQKQTENAKRLTAQKRGTEKAIEGTEAKIGRYEKGDFSKAQRTPVEIDDDLRRARMKLEGLKRTAKRFELEQEAAARSLPKKTLDTGAGAVRTGVLSTPSIIAKLAAFTLTRPLLAPMQTAAGYGWSKMFPETAARAAGEGIPSLFSEDGKNGLPEIPGAIRIEARALAATFTDGIREAGKVLALGDSDKGTLYDPVRRERRWFRPGDWVSALHEALHLPSRVNEFERQLQRRIAHSIRNDIDPRNEFVKAKLEKEAWEASKGAAYLQENALARGWTSALRAMESKSKETGVASGAALTGASLLRAWEPIATVPTNIASDILLEASPIGVARASAGLAWNKIKQMSGNFEGMTDGQANVTMRLLAKGTVGSAFLYLGWVNRDKLGGLYIPGEQKKPDALKPGEAKVFDATIPSNLLHNTFMAEANVGASLGRLVMAPYKKMKSEDYNIVGNTMAVAMGVGEEVPFSQLAKDLTKLSDPKQAESVLAEKAALFMIPGLADWIAKQTDKPDWFDPFEDAKQRKAENNLDAFKARIPGLREDVPETKAQKKRDIQKSLQNR